MTESSTVKNLGAVFDAHVRICRQRRCRHNGDNGGRALLNSSSYSDQCHRKIRGGENFYRDHFVGHWPDDVEVKPLSRTLRAPR
jgi:hypothetical protein